MIEFEIFLYPDAYATGLKAERDGREWNPTVRHLEKLEIYNMQEMEAIWNGSKSASDAMDASVSRGNQLLRKFERANR